MNAAEFYAIVRHEVGPVLKQCGFLRSTDDTDLEWFPRAGRWIKPLPGAAWPAPARLIVSFEHDKWGWLDDSGGGFRLQLEVGQHAYVPALLDAAQRADLLALQALVFARIRRQPTANPRTLDLLEANAAYQSGGDFLPYWDAEDIRAYIRLLLPWIPNLAAQLGGDPQLSDHFTPSRPTPGPH